MLKSSNNARSFTAAVLLLSPGGGVLLVAGGGGGGYAEDVGHGHVRRRPPNAAAGTTGVLSTASVGDRL